MSMLSKSILKFTYLEGLFYALMVSSTETYALYYFTKKGISGVELALLSTLPILLGAVGQLIIPRLVNRAVGQFLLVAQFVQLVGLALIIYCTSHDVPFFWTLTSLSLYWIGGQNAGPLWLDWVSVHCQKKSFSYFLGRRNSFVVFCTMIFFLALSFLIEHGVSFVQIFTLGLIARVLASCLQAIMIYASRNAFHNAHDLVEDDVQEDIKEKEILYSFFCWGGLFRFGVALCSPFFITYMINDLKLSTPSFVLLSAIPFLGRSLFQSNWVRATEQGRSYYGIQVACLAISILPVLWTFSDNFYYLILLQIMSGIFWGGMELTQVLMIQNHAYGSSRRYTGLQGAIFTVFSVLGALCGGILIDRGLTIFDIFNLSTIVRVGLAVVLIIQARKFHLSKLSFRHGSDYLVTVLSIRPSLSNVMKVVPVKIRKSK